MKERLVDCIHRAEKKDSKDELQRDIKKKTGEVRERLAFRGWSKMSGLGGMKVWLPVVLTLKDEPQ